MPFLFSVNGCIRSILSELQLDEVTCIIDDGIDDDIETDCLVFIENSVTSGGQCTVDIKFTYKFRNTGRSCINVASIKAELGPLGKRVLDFSDTYGYLEREMCSNDIWLIPDRRQSVNLCEESSASTTWNILIDVDSFSGGTTNMTSDFTWSISPSVSPSILPSMSPTIDTCTNCTLTGIVSGGKISYYIFFLLLFLSLR